MVKEAALFNISTLRTQTCFRTSDGYFFSWEGYHDRAGSSWGSCTHVYNYEHATGYLFGELAGLKREIEFGRATGEDGLMSFRVRLPLDSIHTFRRAAADGQMGTLVKLYRDWQLSGDDVRLRAMWPAAKKAMAYVWTGNWDRDRDGVMEGAQHNTMDVSYYGPNPQMAAWYLAALRASEEMALYLGYSDFASQCRGLYEKGRGWVEQHLFNGEYYEQLIPPDATTVAQLGKGCLVDQLAGQYLAHTAGLGHVLDPDQVRTTLKSIMRYNIVEGFNDHFNTFRSFGLGDESGLIMASYPGGDCWIIPFPIIPRS